MTLLRALRLLILGETWTLPLGVLLVLAVGAALEAAAYEPWRQAGGFLLLGGVVGVLATSVARGARRRG